MEKLLQQWPALFLQTDKGFLVSHKIESEETKNIGWDKRFPVCVGK